MTRQTDIAEVAAPRRRVVIKLEIGADTWEDAQYALNSLANDIAMRRSLPPWSVSGGYSVGWTLSSSEDETITHDSWAEANEAYCAHLQKDPTK